MADLPEGFDLDALLAPVAGDVPVGADLRDDLSAQSPYFRLRDARAEARAAEREADKDPDAESGMPPQWRTVRQLATQALAERSKDLEIAAWLTEALVRTDGLAGLAAGAQLMSGLVERFWGADLYPKPDEDGLETRVAPVAGLNGTGGDGTLMQPLRKLMLFARADGTPVSLWQYEQSEQVEGIGDAAQKKQRLDGGVVPLADLEKEARAFGPARLTATLRASTQALASWVAMAERLDTAAGADSPPTSRVREILEKFQRVIAKYAPAAVAVDPAEAQAAGGAPDAVGGGAQEGGGAKMTDARGSREDMLRDLARIADYFRRTEPHSPLAYTLEEAVRRARLTWPELLAEVVPESAARANILSMLGIKPPPE